jgi:hypothetical protein
MTAAALPTTTTGGGMKKRRKAGRPPIYQKKSGRDIDISIIIPRDVSRWLIRAGKRRGYSRSMQIRSILMDLYEKEKTAKRQQQD